MSTSPSELVRLKIPAALLQQSIPAWMGDYDLDSYGSLAKTAAHYADGERGEYPMGSRQETWLSAFAYYHADDRRDERIEANLLKAAEYFQLLPELGEIKDAVKTAETQLPDEAFAWVWKGEDGTIERRLPMTNSTNVKQAAAWLVKNATKLPTTDRITIGRRIRARAEKHGVELGKYAHAIKISCADRFVSPEKAIEHVSRWADRHFATPAEKQELLKTASALAQSSTGMTEMADSLTGLDDEDNLASLVDTAEPEQCAPHAKTASGCHYFEDELDTVNYDELRKYAGDGVADTLFGEIRLPGGKKLLSKLASLDQTQSELFDRFMADRTGVKPALRLAEPTIEMLEAQLG